MKKLFKILLIGFILIIMSIGTVNAEIKTDVDYRTGDVIVSGQCDRQADLTIKVKNSDDTVLFFDRVKGDQYGAYKFNFNTDVIYGNYSVELNNNGKKETNNAVTLFDIFVPEFTVVGADSGKVIENLTQLGENEGLTAKLTVEHKPDMSSVEKFDAYMLCAVYDKDGTLTGVKKSETLEATSVDNGISSYSGELAFTGEEAADAAMLKVFLWENGTMKPYTGVYELSDHPFPKEIKILSIGNSFSNNSVTYINEMAKEIGLDLTIGYTYQGGATLEAYANGWYDQGTGTVSYYKRTPQDNVWVHDTTKKSTQVIADEDWDIIFIQQASIDSGDISTYTDENINKMITKIQTNAQKGSDVLIGWHMTWPYADTYKNEEEKDGGGINNWMNPKLYNQSPVTMFAKIVECVQAKIVPDKRFSYILKSGTAIWNARNCEEFVAKVGNMSGEGQHIYGHGSFIAGMAWLRSLGYDITPITAASAPKLTITDRQLELMKAAVNKACENPFECSQIN